MDIAGNTAAFGKMVFGESNSPPLVQTIAAPFDWAAGQVWGTLGKAAGVPAPAPAA